MYVSSSPYHSELPYANTQQGSGSVRGTLVADQVTIANLKVENQSFGAVSQVSQDFNNSPSDGLIGMAFGTIASSKRPTFFENLIMANKVQPFFSVYLTRGQESGSEVSLIKKTVIVMLLIALLIALSRVLRHVKGGDGQSGNCMGSGSI